MRINEGHGSYYPGISQIWDDAVVELFSEWCGPCKSVIPTFKRIRLDKDDENALLFLTVRLPATALCM